MESMRSTVVLFVAICLFAMSAWIGVNGLWVELPLMVHVLPEGWNLPSYFVIIIQVANIAPLAYLVIKKWKPNKVKEWIATCVIIAIGMISSFILIFAWDKTSYVGGEMHSTAVLVLAFFLSTVDCASSVVFLPYMARFKSSTFITALYVGEGFSGLVPAIFGLIQTAGMQSDVSGNSNNTITANTTLTETLVTHITNPYRFSVSVYFVILTLLLAISLVSFLFINFHPYFKRFKFDKPSSNTVVEFHSYKTKENVEDSNNDFATKSEDSSGTYQMCQISSTEHTEVQIQSEMPTNSHKLQESTSAKKLERKDLFKCIVLYFIVTLINVFTNGVHASVHSYACLPYGSMTYDLAVKLSILVNPLACLSTLFVKTRRLSVILIITTIGSLMVAYHIYLAALSPNPILKNEDSGKVLAILSSIVLTACFSYAKVCISTVFYKLEGERLLLYNGVFTQVGSLVGAIIGFLLVGVFNVFKSQ